MGGIVAVFGPTEVLSSTRLADEMRLPPGRGRATRVLAPGAVVEACWRKQEASIASAAGFVVAINGRVTAWADPGSAWPEGFNPRACPAESLALAYRAFGTRAFELMRGHWSALVFDPVSRSVVLARDVPGLRPLFYRIADGCLWVSSELRRLASISGLPMATDAEALGRLVHFCPDPSDSPFREVVRCPPGHAVSLRQVGNEWLKKDHQYWQPEAFLLARLTAGPAELAEELRRLIAIAVERALPKEPSAVALSGGLDSSTLLSFAAIAARREGRVPPLGISLRFRYGGRADEGEFIRSILEFVGLRGEDVWIDGPPDLESIERTAWQAQVPVLPTMPITGALLHRTRELGFSTLLSGHGSDHILDGTWGALGDLWRSRRRRAAIAFGARLWSAGTLSPIEIARIWGGLVLRSQPVLYSLWRSVCGSGIAAPGKTLGTAEADILVARLAFEGSYPLADGHFYIEEEYGVEACYPFFDLDLIAFAFQVPVGLLMLNGVPRGLMRRCIEGYVPAKVRERRSKGDTIGVSVPVWDSWCRRHSDTLRHLRLLGVISTDEMAQLHVKGDVTHEMFRCHVAGVGAFVESWRVPSTNERPGARPEYAAPARSAAEGPNNGGAEPALSAQEPAQL